MSIALISVLIAAVLLLLFFLPIDLLRRKRDNPVPTTRVDERDVMFFSVGYGFDEDGKFTMNFGPLNEIGGHRRLNVAISRARMKVKVFASILPSDLNTTSSSSQGVFLLKEYLLHVYRNSEGNGSVLNKAIVQSSEETISTIEDQLFSELIKNQNLK